MNRVLRILLFASVLAATMPLPAGAAQDDWYIPKRSEILDKGRSEIGLRMQYTPDVNGVLNSRRLEFSPSIRYSPWRRFEMYAEVPLVFANAERIENFDLIRSEDNGIGDAFLQLSYDAFGKQDWKVMLHVDQTFPTGVDPYDHAIGLGGGHYRIAPGVTWLTVIDPLVIYTYIGHQWSTSSTHSSFGKIAPGNDWRFRVGSNLTLGPRVSASLFTAWDVVANTELDDARIIGSSGDVVRIGAGLSWLTMSGSTMRINATYGVTDAASDATIGFELSTPLRSPFSRSSVQTSDRNNNVADRRAAPAPLTVSVMSFQNSTGSPDLDWLMDATKTVIEQELRDSTTILSPGQGAVTIDGEIRLRNGAPELAAVIHRGAQNTTITPIAVLHEEWFPAWAELARRIAAALATSETL